MRMCIGCRTMRPKYELLRMTADRETGEIRPDIGHNIQARGVYLCKNEACIQLARKKRALERSFKRQVPENIYERAAEDWIRY